MALIRSMIVFAFLCFLTSCANNNTTGSVGGAAIGGAAGVGSGLLLGANNTVIALMGLTGASIGYYVTTLGADAEGFVQAGGQVYSVGDYVTIVIPSDQIFDSNSAELLPSANPVLNSALDVVNRYPDRNVAISGNTSGFGRSRYEQILSEKRARQVATYFWGRGISNFRGQSIETRRLIYVGYGDLFPISNHIKANSIRENSRIQITLFPSRSDLIPGKCYTVFNNIGKLDST